MKENKVITNIEQLTPERLTRIFKNKGYLSQGEVTKIIRRNSQESLSSNLHFLDINFSNNAQTKPVSPEIVIKIPKRLAKFFGKHEAKFYSIIAETMDEMPIPTCYDAVYSNITILSHLILENLSDTHIELPPVPPSKQHCEKAIDCLAELHAFWWNHPKLKEFTRHSVVLWILKENSFVNHFFIVGSSQLFVAPCFHIFNKGLSFFERKKHGFKVVPYELSFIYLLFNDVVYVVYIWFCYYE